MSAFVRNTKIGLALPRLFHPLSHPHHRTHRDGGKTNCQTSSSTEQRYQAIARPLPASRPASGTRKLALAEDAGDVFLSAGQTLFKQKDDPGETFYIIRKGEVDIFVRRGETAETKLGTLKAGDFFGEMSALTGQARSATLRAASPVLCVEICTHYLKPVSRHLPRRHGKSAHVVAHRNAHRQTVTETPRPKKPPDNLSSPRKFPSAAASVLLQWAARPVNSADYRTFKIPSKKFPPPTKSQSYF